MSSTSAKNWSTETFEPENFEATLYIVGTMPGFMFAAAVTRVRSEEGGGVGERMVSVCVAREGGETNSEVDGVGEDEREEVREESESLGEKPSEVCRALTTIDFFARVFSEGGELIRECRKREMNLTALQNYSLLKYRDCVIR